MAPPKLPTELIRHIIVDFVGTNHRQSLYRLVSTSSIFRDIAEPLLYQSMSLELFDPQEPTSNQEVRLEALHNKLLVDMGRLASLVRKLEVRILGDVIHPQGQLARKIMRLLIGVNHVTIDFQHPASFLDCFASVRFPHLSVLKLKGYPRTTYIQDMNVCSFLRYHPSIVHLEIPTILLQIGSTMDSFNPRFPRLRKLVATDPNMFFIFRQPISHFAITSSIRPSIIRYPLPEPSAIRYLSGLPSLDADDFLDYARSLPNLQYLSYQTETADDISIGSIRDQLDGFHGCPNLVYLRLWSYFDADDVDSSEDFNAVIQDIFERIPTLLIIDFCDSNTGRDTFTRFFAKNAQLPKVLSSPDADDMWPLDEELEIILGLSNDSTASGDALGPGT